MNASILKGKATTEMTNPTANGRRKLLNLWTLEGFALSPKKCRKIFLVEMSETALKLPKLTGVKSG